MGYTVYKHTSPDGKIYIGITGKSRPEDRWHKGQAYKNNKHFYNAIQKHGWANFKHEIIESGLSQDEAEQMEKTLISYFHSNDAGHGYNIASGGKSNSGFKHSKETKRRIAESLKGKRHTEERRRNQSEAQKRLWENEAHRKKQSDSHKGKYRGADNACSMRVEQYDLNGNMIGVFGSMGEAERQTGTRHQGISACCANKVKTANGFIWKLSK